MKYALFLFFCVAPVCVVGTSFRSGGATVAFFNNTYHAGVPESTVFSPGLSISTTSSTARSAILSGSMTVKTGYIAFECKFAPNVVSGFVWIGDHMVCFVQSLYQSGQAPAPIVTDGTSENPVHIYSDRNISLRTSIVWSGTAGSSVDVLVSVAPPTANGNPPSSMPPFGPPSLATLSPDVSPQEKARRAFQKDLATGWGPFLSNSMAVAALLPIGASITVDICHGSQCVGEVRSTLISQMNVRLGRLIPDGSLWEFSFAPSIFAGTTLNFTVAAGKGSDSASALLMTVDGACTGSLCGALGVNISFRYLWSVGGEGTFQPMGNGSASPVTVAFRPDGGLAAPTVAVSFAPEFSAPAIVSSAGPYVTLSFPLGALPLAFSTDSAVSSYAAIKSLFEHRYAVEQRAIAAKFPDPTLRSAYRGTAATIFWNAIYAPFEAAVILPVSRSWNFNHGVANGDHEYVIFDWDNFFASYLSLADARLVAIGISNLIQVGVSSTSEGFIPNWSAGASKSQDRTEPPVGAMVLERVFARVKTRYPWLAPLLFPHMQDWLTWFERKRMLSIAPAPGTSDGSVSLVALGSTGPGNTPANMQNARYESGLDNSPMYDGEFFDDKTGLMQLADVGMTSMVAASYLSLANIADELGNAATATALRRSGNMLADNLIARTWDATNNVFCNVFVNGSFYRRISPTSFYPLMTGRVTGVQAHSMVSNWLLNPTRFCVSLTGLFNRSASAECYWGLPSINAEDPAFPPLGYWRGFVWGPQAQLTFWSLSEAGNLDPFVMQARDAMVQQLTLMFVQTWDKYTYICETYLPYNTHEMPGCATPTKDYHWGALHALISLEQHGMLVKL